MINPKFTPIIETLSNSTSIELESIRLDIMDAFGMPPGSLGPETQTGGVREPRVPLVPLLITSRKEPTP